MSESTAVVFDMDGTLTDTEDTWDEVRRELAAEDGVQWPEEATRAMMGMATQEWAVYLNEKVGLAGTPADSARRTIDGMARAYREGEDLIIPGAEAAIRRMAARGPIGLATSSPRVLIDAALDLMNVTELFGATLSTEELGGVGKPAPDVYLEVCRRLGVDPRNAVAVEDSSAGIRAAKAAGMAVIAIPPHFHPPSPQTLAMADVVLESLDELTTDLVEQVLAAR